MPVSVYKVAAAGHDFLVEDPAVAGEVPFDVAPAPLELSSTAVFPFGQDMIRLGQGVTGVAVVGDRCLPIVAAHYFQTDRAPASGVHTIPRTPSAAPPGSRRFFVFGVPGASGFQFALSMTQVLEVSRPLPMASLHFEYSHFAGAAVWRGEAIPVVDLAFAARLGSMDQEAWLRMVIVRNVRNRVFSIPASGPVRQPGAAAQQVYAPDSVSVRPMRGIRGVFRFEGSPLLTPDLDALID